MGLALLIFGLVPLNGETTKGFHPLGSAAAARIGVAFTLQGTTLKVHGAPMCYFGN
jgi:hypothetical protein